MKIKKNTVNSIICYAIVIGAFIFCQASMGSMTRLMKGQLVNICAYVVMAVSLNLVVGISGELSLGHACFMSIGAFSGVVISSLLGRAFQFESTILQLVITMILSGIIAGIFGALIGIPVLRLRGDYLAIVTLAFGEIVRSVLKALRVGLEDKRLVMSMDAAAIWPKSIKEVIAGAQGAKVSDKISSLSNGGFIVGFGLVLFTLFVVLNLVNSRSGRAILASRDNRIAAEAMGINVTKYKMIAFVTAAVLAGMAVTLYGLSMAKFNASDFDYNKSIEILVFVVLGGIGNIWGSIISAIVLTVLPTMLYGFNDYRMLVYAIVLILVMLLTNSPALRNVLGKVIPSRKSDGVEASNKEGVAQ